MPIPQTLDAVLESGDHLTRAEFHRRYCNRPDIKKAELVEGVVYLASPVRVTHHGKPHGHVMLWLGAYGLSHPDVVVADNSTVQIDDNNELQPDAFLWRDEPGGARLTSDDYIEGAPRFVVEVAASSASYDLHQKLRVYQRSGVEEYVVWRVFQDAIDWFRLTDGEYVQVPPDANGVIESTTFPGLRLHVAKMLAGDLRGVLAELER